MRNLKLVEYVVKEINRLADETLKNLRVDDFGKGSFCIDELNSKVKELREQCNTAKSEAVVPKKTSSPVHLVKQPKAVRGIYMLDASMLLYCEVFLDILMGFLKLDQAESQISSDKLWDLMCDRMAPINTDRKSIINIMGKNVFPSLKGEFELRTAHVYDSTQKTQEKVWFFTSKTVEAVKSTVARLRAKKVEENKGDDTAPAAMGG